MTTHVAAAAAMTAYRIGQEYSRAYRMQGSYNPSYITAQLGSKIEQRLVEGAIGNTVAGAYDQYTQQAASMVNSIVNPRKRSSDQVQDASGSNRDVDAPPTSKPHTVKRPRSSKLTKYSSSKRRWLPSTLRNARSTVVRRSRRRRSARW